MKLNRQTRLLLLVVVAAVALWWYQQRNAPRWHTSSPSPAWAERTEPAGSASSAGAGVATEPGSNGAGPAPITTELAYAGGPPR